MNKEKIQMVYPSARLLWFTINKCAVVINTELEPYYMFISQVYKNEEAAWKSAEEEIDKMLLQRLEN